jgi:hypothetical protein
MYGRPPFYFTLSVSSLFLMSLFYIDVIVQIPIEAYANDCIRNIGLYLLPLRRRRFVAYTVPNWFIFGTKCLRGCALGNQTHTNRYPLGFPIKTEPGDSHSHDETTRHSALV